VCLFILGRPIWGDHQDFIKSLSLIGLIQYGMSVLINVIPFVHQPVVDLYRILPGLNARRSCDRPGNTLTPFHGVISVPGHNSNQIRVIDITALDLTVVLFYNRQPVSPQGI